MSGANRAPLRIGALYSHPIQYFAPVFREVAARPGIDLTVYFCTDQGLHDSFDPEFGQVFRWDVPLLDGYRSKFLSNWTGQHRTDGFFRLINPAIVTEIARGQCDVLLMHGYEHATKLMAIAAARAARTPILMRGDSNLLHARSASRRAAKDVVLSRLLRGMAGCLYVGRHNREYYEHYGVPAQKLHFAPYCVDNDAWQARRTAAAGSREAVRATWHAAPDVPVILCAGKLVAKKQPLLLLEAFRRVRQRRRCALVFAGDGGLRESIERTVQSGNIPDVHITGFLNQGELAPVYGAADVFALPSAIEPWGLAVNEAMNFSLPVIVSDRVGCRDDLVRHDENGFVVPAESVEPLAVALDRLVADAALRERFGRQSLATIEAWSVAACADGIVSAARAVSRQAA